MHVFSTSIKIIGVNPYVDVPKKILSLIFLEASKDKGPIPVRGTINKLPYSQTLVKYTGEWRLYINMKMLKNSPRRIGEEILISIEYDPGDRSIPIHPKLQEGLHSSSRAQHVFNGITPSLQHEINRYITRLKSDEKVDENVKRAVDFLEGKGTFVGRKLK